jgi:hypothetical protein
MRNVLGYLLNYQRDFFDWRVYLLIGVFLAVCIGVNYHLNFEHSVINAYYGQPVRWLWMFLFHSFPFLVICLILAAFGKIGNCFVQPEFWLKLVVGLGILSFDRAFYGVDYLAEFFPRTGFYFISKSINWASSLLVTVLPMLVAYYFLERQDQPRIWYGLSMRKFDPKPYLMMLLIMAVVIGMGSSLGDIRAYYPRVLHAKMDAFLSIYDWQRWQAVALYEICYGSDFVSVELVFRGFLVFAFTRTLGPYAVLAMVGSYCFLHFDKPMTEAISSILGGYILGIISLNTRSIWGGVCLHVGVAWLMELFGWWQAIHW